MAHEVASTQRGAPGGPGAPWWVLGSSCALLTVSYFLIFLKIPKLTESKSVNFSESVYLPYHIPPLFQLFGSVPEGLPYVLFRCHGLDNIAFNINWRTWDIMFNSLTIDHLRVSAFRIINFYCTGTIDLFDNIRSFPFREKLTCKKNLKWELYNKTYSPTLNSRFWIFLSCHLLTFSLKSLAFSYAWVLHSSSELISNNLFSPASLKS